MGTGEEEEEEEEGKEEEDGGEEEDRKRSGDIEAGEDKENVSAVVVVALVKEEVEWFPLRRSEEEG